jgi:hypothetical protein
MTPTQAHRFLGDIRSNLTISDYCQTIYISIREVGTKSFDNACYQSLEGWLFIWTKDDAFCVPEKELGDFVCIDTLTMPTYSLCEERSNTI